MLDTKAVSKVVIHNRRDCCQNRIDGAKVIKYCSLEPVLNDKNEFEIPLEPVLDRRTSYRSEQWYP